MTIRPFTPVPNVVKVIIDGTSSDLNWNNVLHMIYGGAPPTLASVTALAEFIYNQFVDQFATLMPVVSSVQRVTVIDLSSASSNVGIYEANTAGGSVGELLPASVAFLVSYPVSLRYRGGHPRTYLFIGVWSDLADQSHWSTDFVASATTAITDFQASIVGTTEGGTTYTSQCAVSYRSADAWRETPLPLAISTGVFEIGTQIASQRRRMRRRT